MYLNDEVDEDDGIADDDAAEGDHADHGGGGEEDRVVDAAHRVGPHRIEQPEPGHDADHGQGDGEHDHHRQQERPGLVDQQHVDHEQGGGDTMSHHIPHRNTDIARP